MTTNKDLRRRETDKFGEWVQQAALDDANKRIAELEAMISLTWLPIETAPRDETKCIYYSPGNKKAGNRSARKPYINIDYFCDEWPRALYQYPEAPYTHWMPAPPAPATNQERT